MALLFLLLVDDIKDLGDCLELKTEPKNPWFSYASFSVLRICDFLICSLVLKSHNFYYFMLKSID